MAFRKGCSCRLLPGLILSLCCLISLAVANRHAKRLYNDLMVSKGYNKLVRPVQNDTDILTVKIGLKLSQLIGVDEKNQVLTTNVWVSQEWSDSYLTWNPGDYGGVDRLYIPAEELWKPDIVCYDNADGDYHITLMTKVTVYNTGRVFWEPPAIYKSACAIDVEFFPFDEQTCSMKFSSWTFDGRQIDLRLLEQADIAGEVNIPNAIDLTHYYTSFIWDIMSTSASKNIRFYPCCTQPYPDVTFTMTIRRKTLFYTVNLIVPCVCISLLSVLVFYLPSDSREKIALCISILLSLTVFFLLLSDLIPPTSLVTPLIGKYLLFTMALVTLSVIITVIVLNIHNRTQNVYTMSPLTRKIFLVVLPEVLFMSRPDQKRSAFLDKRIKESVKHGFVPDTLRKLNAEAERLLKGDSQSQQSGRQNKNSQNLKLIGSHGYKHSTLKRLDRDEVRALKAIKSIVQHLQDEETDEQIVEDWKYVAMVLDRLFLWIFTTACIVGTLGVILQAPTLYDTTEPIS